jgi:hypothetical protein
MHSSRVNALVAVILAAILSSTLQVATAQQKTTTNNVFLTYRDSVGGFKVLYPSNWITSASSPTDAIFDSAPVKVGEPITDSIRIEISVRNVDQYLDTKQMILKNKTVYDYVDAILRDATFKPMAPSLKVPSTLPIAEKMFDSFEFIKKQHMNKIHE